jgi:hypothetical protein
MITQPCSKAGDLLAAADRLRVPKMMKLVSELSQTDTQEWHNAAAAAAAAAEGNRINFTADPLERGQIFDQGVAHHKRDDATAVEDHAPDIGQTSYSRGVEMLWKRLENALESIQRQGNYWKVFKGKATGANDVHQVSMCVCVCVLASSSVGYSKPECVFT